ncbi:NADH-quinone oxidoreductase subunit N [Luteolibacter yonseiensis]|uniref:NADH-quinone oxidoreductase subunit N n=1 Tax=Luteolibacter yonseiensis TaxID=1144680 RepID=A0A934R9G1_9BACT|nr:NADH-quinone oxidoreductase subunit N [Luteolibacter yonseiensis]MBK1817920.1 NADH-quinone oxidoreductase subunit N [Luteolibacter yonseiensis]
MPAFILEILTVFLGVFLLMAEAFLPGKNKSWVGIAAVFGLTFILGLTFVAVGPSEKIEAGWVDYPLWNFYNFDSLAKFYKIFALLTTILVLLLAVDYRKILARFTEGPESENGTGEYYALPIFACAGMMWLASARDLAGAFVALELVTVTFYILVAYMRRNVGSLEAGVKYLILGALSTGFLVYGIAWVYGSLGTMSLPEIATRLDTPHTTFSVASLLFGIALVLVGLGFKIGAVPMQVWIPDVYQGAPTPTTAFLSVGSKAAGFILTIRFLEPFLNSEITRVPVLAILLIMACATLLFGNLAAIPQTNFKRLLAYSSIAHAGFLILALAAWAPETANSEGSIKVVSFYLATYLLMTLGVFFVLSQIRIQRDGEEISNFNGLGKTNPQLALMLTVLLAALAGVPLTAGFLGKFMVFSLAVDAGLWWGVGVAFIAAAAGFYYYFSVIRAIWWMAAEDEKAIVLPKATKICVATLSLAVLVLGVFPQPIWALLR